MLKLEVKFRAFQSLVFLRVEAEELRGAVGSGGGLFRERDEQIHRQDFFAEVAFVERGLQDGFVEVLELREGEFLREQLEADGLVTDFSAQARLRGGVKFSPSGAI